MGRVISFINFKGGVGKTASVVNIGSLLAKYHGRRVLIVDLDAQSNASLWLMHPEKWKAHVGNGRFSTYQIFHDEIQGTKFFDFERAVVRGVPRRDFSLIANLDLLPASVDLLRIEDTIRHNRYVQFFKFLHRALKPWRDHYDYILVDCPPNLYSVTKNALFFSDYCVVPYLPDFLSLSGLHILAEKVEEFYAQVSGSLTGRPKPWIAAFLVSHYREVGNVFQHAVNELEIHLHLARERHLIHPKAAILQPFIRHNVAVAESTNEHLPVVLHRPGSLGAQDYNDIAANFLNHFENVL